MTNKITTEDKQESFGTNVKLQIKQIATGLGVEEEVADNLAEKCYSDVYWRPWGGATSFREIDEMEATRDFSYKVDTETSKLRGIIENITESDDLSVDEKVSTIQGAAESYRSRINGIDIANSDKSLVDKIKDVLLGTKTIKKENGKWVLYTKDGKRKLGTHESKEEALAQERVIEANKEMPKVGGFKVYLDNEGQYRWLSFSSNAFEDLEKELFTTNALKEAIEYADKQDERGPLLIYHIPSAEIGHCDFQTMEGRFLIESGTFDDTPLGNKAREYFVNSDEEHQVSIGYLYHDGDEKDGQYDWLRITERSVTPNGAAANPWTSFKVIGEENMDSNHLAMLEKVFGKEMTQTVISEADAKTKELEQKVRFKEKKTEPEISESLKNIKTLIDALPENEENKAVREQLVKDYDVLEKAIKYEEDDEEKEEKKKESDSEGKKEEVTGAVAADVSASDDASPPASESEQLRQVASLITSLAENIDSVKETVSTLQEDMKALKEDDDEKVAELRSPRTSAMHRPTESEGNVIGEEAVKALVGVSADTVEEDPAKKYVDDIFKRYGISN